ncbi:MAG: group II truncated hemoglobin [Methylococcaceae bacterium]|nr:group II truncated hemoglobin [Methylococcaceae bacterium]
MTEKTIKTPYELMGGENTILSLVDRFYYYMDTLPEVAGVRKMHAQSLSSAKDKLFKFLSGWLGGPDLFIQEYGHPMLRKRHFPFAIGTSERDQWMFCMTKAMTEITMDSALRVSLLEALDNLATHMVNQ